jgi:hypothetical protein
MRIASEWSWNRDVAVATNHIRHRHRVAVSVREVFCDYGPPVVGKRAVSVLAVLLRNSGRDQLIVMVQATETRLDHDTIVR